MRHLGAVLKVANSERGAALVMALLVLVILTAFGLTLVGLGMTEVAISTNWRDYSKDFYAAEAALQSGVTQLQGILQTTQVSTIDQTTLDGNIAKPTLNTPGTSYTAFSVTPVIPFPNNTYSTTFATGPFQGLNGIVSAYQIRAQVTGQGGTRADLTQVFQYTQVPLFQFNVFYGKGVDLEIWPGPNMTLNGKVFANSNLYIGSGNTLQVQGFLKTAGKIFRTVKRDVSTFSPTLNPVTGTYDPTSYAFSDGQSPPVNPQILDASGNLQSLSFDTVYQSGGSSKWATPDGTAWADQAKTTFGGTVADGAMGVTSIVPPIPALLANPNASNPDQLAHQLIELPQASDSAALAAAKLYSQAGLRVVDGAVTNQSGGSATLPAGTITTTAFYDSRENKCVVTTQVDVAKLNPAKPANGILYVGSSSATSTTVCASAMPGVSTMYGVRLVNGSDLANSGLSVVSPNPVYIQGDYNTKTYGTFKDPVTGNNTHPPAAVIGDSVTILSQNWQANDSDSTSKSCATCSTTSRPAATTTVNAGIMTGPSAESTTGNGNGQLENNLRFLENWSGTTLNYSGSIVSLWHSMQATTPWRCCGTGGTAPNQQYYSPPTRNWSYDTLFNTTPPPGTVMGIIMSRGRFSQS